MQRSTERILTTHTGSLPRPDDLVQLMWDKEDGRTVDLDRLAERVRSATAEVARRQVEVGIDVVSDGDVGKPSYSTYMKDRLSGFDGEGSHSRPRSRRAEADDYPEYFARLGQSTAATHLKMPTCTGPVTVKDPDAVQRDIANFKAALESLGPARPVEAFITAASPGIITYFLQNEYYPSHEAYLAALADAMRPEYEAIAAAGFVLQIDCPDLASARTLGVNADLTTEQFRAKAQVQIEALNQAVANIPPEQMRLHLCWGNLEGPHHLDIPLKEIIDVVFEARPSAVSFAACNPRHDHEWKLFEQVKLPEGKILIPGVIDSTTNFIEHPELVAQRITRYASLVGRENVMVGSDCGFGTAVGRAWVDPKIAWAKLATMAEGARLASAELW